MTTSANREEIRIPDITQPTAYTQDAATPGRRELRWGQNRPMLHDHAERILTEAVRTTWLRGNTHLAVTASEDETAMRQALKRYEATQCGEWQGDTYLINLTFEEKP